MGLSHAKPGQVIELLPQDVGSESLKTAAIIKTKYFEVIRLHIRAGEAIPTHKAKGPITVQCLEGKVIFTVGEDPHELLPGNWLYLEGKQDHSLNGIKDTLLLLTIIFPH